MLLSSWEIRKQMRHKVVHMNLKACPQEMIGPRCSRMLPAGEWVRRHTTGT